MKRRHNPGQGKGPRHKTYITGSDVLKHRKKLGLLQRDVAKLCKLSQAYVSFLERKGSGTIGWHAAKKLVSFFGGAGTALSKKKLRRAKPRRK